MAMNNRLLDLAAPGGGGFGPLAGYEYVRQAGEQGRQRGLQALAGQAYTASPEQRGNILSRLGQQDPAMARQTQQFIDADRSAAIKRVSENARYIVGMHKAGQGAAIGPAYSNLVREARALGMADAPEQWDDSFVPGLEVLANIGLEAEGQPAGWREFEQLTNAANLKPGSPEYIDAANIRLGRSGRASNAGYSFDTIDIGDGRQRPARMNPRNGAQEYYDESTQQWTSLGGGASPGGAPVQPGGYYAGSGPSRVNVNLEGISPERQQQLANVASAMQAAGYGEDAIMGWISEATNADAASAGFPDPEVPSQPIAPRGAGASLTKAEEAASVREAETAVDLRNADAVAAAEANAARRKKEAEALGEFNANAPKRRERYQQAMTAAANVQSALNSALDLIGPQSTGFIGARMRGVEGSPAYNLAAQIETVKANLGFDRLQQMRDASPTGGALGAIAIQELVALQSTIANLDPNQSEAQIRNNLLRIQEHYRNWVVAVQQAMQQEQAGGDGPTDQRREALLDKY